MPSGLLGAGALATPIYEQWVDEALVGFGKAIQVYPAISVTRNQYGQASPAFGPAVECIGRCILEPTPEDISIIGNLQGVDIAILFSRLELVREFPIVAAVCASVAETFALVDEDTLTVKVDGGAEQTVTFVTADFVDIANATAAEVVVRITAELTGVVATDVAGVVTLTSSGVGRDSSLEVTGGAANAALGFSTSLITGTGAAENGWISELDQVSFEGLRYRLLKVHPSGRIESRNTLVILLGGNIKGEFRQ